MVVHCLARGNARRIRLALAPLILALAAESTASVCDTEVARESKQLLSVPAGETLAVRIVKHDLNIQVQLSDGASNVTAAGPTDLAGSEYLLLPAGDWEVAVASRYQGSTSGGFELFTHRPDSDSAVSEALAKMHRASVLWSTKGADAREEALQLLGAVATAEIAFWNLSQEAELALSYGYVSRFKPAEAEKLLRRRLERGVPRLYETQWLLGFSLLEQFRWSEAVELLESARSDLLTLEKRSGSPCARSNTASGIYKDLAYAFLLGGETGRGQEALERSVALAADDARALAHALNNYGFYHIVSARALTGVERRRELLHSLEKHLSARDQAVLAGDLQVQAIALNNLAAVYQRLGDIGSANDAFLEALRLLDGSDELSVLVYLLSNLGSIAKNMGEYDRSKEYLERGLELTEVQAPRFATLLICALGSTERELGQLSRARSLHSACAKNANREGQSREEATAWFELALDNESDPVRYEEALSRAYALAGQLEPGDARSRIFARQALLLDKRGELDAAVSLMQQALVEAESVRYRESRVDTLDAHRRLRLQRGETDLAIEAGASLIAEIEDIHLELNRGFLGASWSDRTHEYYVAHVETLLATAEDDADLLAAIQTFERSRAISLKAAESRELQRSTDVDAFSTFSVIANEKALAGQKLGFDYYMQRDLLAYQSRQASVLKSEVFERNWRDAQAHLEEEEVVIYPLLGKQGSWLFAIRRDDMVVKKIDSAEQILSWARIAREGIERGESKSPELAALSRAILPTELLKTSQHLIIVPHRALHAFPFAAMRSPDNGGAILETHTVRTSPALTFVHKDASVGAEFSVEVAVIADPVFNSLGAQVPVDSSDTYSGWSSSLTPLPWTAREAVDLKDRFGASNTLVFTQYQANRASLLSAPVRNARILHIATHGYFHESHPDNVGLALSVIDNKGVMDSGFLTLSELMSYDFNNELVVISGCDTSMGQSFAGEGMMGLSRGFLEQGAKNVVSTLWPVSDRASAAFMRYFYADLVEDADIKDALRTAQLSMKNNRRYREAQHWAGYVLTSTGQH